MGGLVVGFLGTFISYYVAPKISKKIMSGSAKMLY
jgi:hypothetical protein